MAPVHGSRGGCRLGSERALRLVAGVENGEKVSKYGSIGVEKKGVVSLGRPKVVLQKERDLQHVRGGLCAFNLVARDGVLEECGGR